MWMGGEVSGETVRRASGRGEAQEQSPSPQATADKGQAVAEAGVGPMSEARLDTAQTARAATGHGAVAARAQVEARPFLGNHMAPTDMLAWTTQVMP